jgi:ATPase subunit of ABC transporter with duplicated ATPase domains
MQRNILDEVQPQIDEIHEGASRSADAEVEEYRQLQQQRIGELEETRASLEARIKDLSRITEKSNSQTDRTEALKQRRELRSQLDEIETKSDDLQRRRERGFPKKQGEIRNRHALEIVIKPVTLTEVAYERGEISLTMTDQTSSRTLTVGYGSGVGVTEDVECENCGASLSESNPIRLSGDGIRCSDC